MELRRVIVRSHWDDGLAPDEIAALLADAHGIAPHAAKADVARIVVQWRTAGLLGADTPPPGPDAPIPVLPDSDTPHRTADHVIDGRAFPTARAPPDMRADQHRAGKGGV